MTNTINKFPASLILKKIFKDNLSGELIISGEQFNKKLFFIKGDLAFASTSVIQERLGDILLAAGKISHNEYTKLTKIKAVSSMKAGEILREITNLTSQDIYYALLFQVKTIALSLFELNEGAWMFTEKIPVIPANQHFKIKLANIIVEGIDKIENISYFKEKFYYRAPVFAPILESTARFLSSDDIKFYMKLTNYSNTSLAHIIADLIVPEIFFWKKIILLYLLNVMDFVEYTVDKEQNKNIEEINELYDQIKSQKVDYYKLLGVKSTATTGEIKVSYLNSSRKYHPDRIQVAPDSTVKKKANEVFAEINKAFEVLSKKNKKKEYDQRGHKDKDEPGEILFPGYELKKARELYLKANALYKMKQYWKAASLLEEAVKLDKSKASYFLLLGLSQSKSPETQKLAEKNLKIAAEMEPWNADPVFALGELYRSVNFLKKADAQFKKALELNMEHTLAGKAVKEMEMLYGKKKPLFSLFGPPKNGS
ncbi:MAG: DnaJ domain-containing protein [Acidobacteria bacterium]|jgi:curved DNA-binding protein CbpA|nr:DnaJ domain-containing protein [Acidobacteriota bacterium]